jgi:hypothetical protein
MELGKVRPQALATNIRTAEISVGGFRMTADIARCNQEIAAATEALREGHPREDLLLRWRLDWMDEKHLLEKEMPTYIEDLRSCAENLADSRDCDRTCGILCQRCGFCLRHCCCNFWFLLSEWQRAVLAEVGGAE